MSPQSTFESMLVDQLRPHPKNIRHEVVPTDELVASIKQDGILQPLVVSPHPTLEGDYTLIAGHHRLAAAKKAGLAELPVVIRHDLDTEGKQLAAMVAENMHRTDITATEEADAYQAMLDLGEWDVKAIAKATGHKQARVKDRLKLGKLDESQRKALDDGQLTIERALVIAEFSAHPDLQEKLVEAAHGQPYNWGYYAEQAKTTLQWRDETEPKLRSELTSEAGVEVVDRPAVRPWHDDYPYRHIDADTPAEAKAAGAMAILDDECAGRGVPEYVVLKGTQLPDEAGESPEEAERRRAREEIDARTAAHKAALADVVDIESGWILDIMDLAKAGDEKVTRVVTRWFAAASEPAVDHYFGWFDSVNTDSMYDVLGIAPTGDHDEKVRRIKQAMAAMALTEQVTAALLAHSREAINTIYFWRDRDREVTNSCRWYRLRKELGWELTDPEVAAQAFADELWPPEPDEEPGTPEEAA